MRSITLTRPDDWHVHLRDGDYLKDTVRDIARYFGRGIIMPNLVPPVTEVSQARAYRDNIVSLVPAGAAFMPLMTLYLTDATSEETVIQAKQSGFINAFKLYPAGATTNSESGVDAIEALYPVFEAMQQHDMVLAIHGEVTDDDVDIFDREAVFIDRHFAPIVERFPELKVVFEHVTTREAVQFVEQARDRVGATITAHHLLYNRNDLLAGGMRSLFYCLPVLKRDTHRQALIDAATSENPRFFLGTDSAPHPRYRKENACGCAAGCYSAHAALELYAEAFDSADSLERLEDFASHRGPDFYGLPRNKDKVVLAEEAWTVPEALTFGNEELIPLRCGEEVRWTVKDVEANPV
jgi:dihydroorotase